MAHAALFGADVIGGPDDGRCEDENQRQKGDFPFQSIHEVFFPPFLM